MSIECFIKWAKSTRRKGAAGAGLDGAGAQAADHPGGKGKAGSFVIEDFDAKELFSREWEVPIYGPIRRAGTAD